MSRKIVSTVSVPTSVVTVDATDFGALELQPETDNYREILKGKRDRLARAEAAYLKAVEAVIVKRADLGKARDLALLAIVDAHGVKAGAAAWKKLAERVGQTSTASAQWSYVSTPIASGLTVDVLTERVKAGESLRVIRDAINAAAPKKAPAKKAPAKKAPAAETTGSTKKVTATVGLQNITLMMGRITDAVERGATLPSRAVLDALEDAYNHMVQTIEDNMATAGK